MQQQQRQYEEVIPEFIKESAARENALKFFSQRNDFHQKFLEARKVHEVDAAKSLETFHKIASRKSRIVPDDSGRYFWRRFRQAEEDCYGTRIWVPESGRFQLTVGFTDNQFGMPSSKKRLRAATMYLPAEVWSVPLPAGESVMTWRWMGEKKIESVEVNVNDQQRIFHLQFKASRGVGLWQRNTSQQQAVAANQCVRLFGFTPGGTNSRMKGFVDEQLQVAIEPVEESP